MKIAQTTRFKTTKFGPTPKSLTFLSRRKFRKEFPFAVQNRALLEGRTKRKGVQKRKKERKGVASKGGKKEKKDA